jgi:hypothetical protein
MSELTNDLLGLGIGLILVDAVVNHHSDNRKSKKKRKEEKPFEW